MTLPMSGPKSALVIVWLRPAKSRNLRLAVETSVLPDVDMHPSFRTLMQHKAFLHEWLQCYVGEYTLFLGEPL